MTNPSSKKKSWLTTGYLTRIAMLAALASVLALFEIPVIAFYKLDFSNLPVLLGGFAMGPVAGVVILALKCLIGLLHTSSMGIGKLADFLMGAALVLPAAILYQRNKTRKTALLGMLLGTLCMVVVSVLTNKYILFPFYMNAFKMDIQGLIYYVKVAGIDSEWKILLLITAPFNLLKGFVLSLITGLIYKPLSPILKAKKKE